MSEIEKDQRFKTATIDPRFHEYNKKHNKIKVDKRFAAMFNDSKFKITHKKDKFGRKIKPPKISNEINKFYELNEKMSDTNNNEDVEKESITSSSDEYEYESDINNNDKNEKNSISNLEVKNDKNVVLGQPTNRLAILNLEWSYIRAVDILVVLQSFLPCDRLIESVSIFPTEFGDKQMQMESNSGPKEIWSNNNETTFDPEKLRNYELKRMQYYIAVVICDSIDTAALLYRECDGIEFEHSSNILDLRFIPENKKYDNNNARDIAKEIPLDYKAPDFYSKSLQHSNIELTWDKTDPNRSQFFQKSFSKSDILENDFDAYLASDDSENDGTDFIVSEDELEKNEKTYLKKKVRNRFSALLNDLKSSKLNENLDSDASYSDEEENMNITFNPGLSERIDKKIALKSEENKSVFEKTQKRLKEKRKDKKENMENDITQEELNDPFFADAFDDDDYVGKDEKLDVNKEKKGKKRKMKLSKKEKKKLEKEKQDLELLMLKDDNLSTKNNEMDNENFGYDLKDLLRRNKKSKRKNKIKNNNSIFEDNFEIDMKDSRFSALYTNSLYNIDPTNPLYKRTEAMDKFMKKRQKYRYKLLNSDKKNDLRGKESLECKTKANNESCQINNEAKTVKDKKLRSLINSVKENQMRNNNSVYVNDR